MSDILIIHNISVQYIIKWIIFVTLQIIFKVIKYDKKYDGD